MVSANREVNGLHRLSVHFCLLFIIPYISKICKPSLFCEGIPYCPAHSPIDDSTKPPDRL